MLVATVTVSFSPTVSIAVITESRARGPLSELVLALVVLADLMLILLFTLSMEGVRFALGSGQAGHGILSGLAWEIFGSFAFGGIVGACFAFYLRYVGREVTVVLLGVAILLSQVGAALHFEPLLAALGAGLVVENIAPPEGDALRLAVERGALPILVLFFAAAGANLHLGALAEVGVFAVAIAALRMALIHATAKVGARVAGLGRRAAGTGVDGAGVAGRRDARARDPDQRGVPGLGRQALCADRVDDHAARDHRPDSLPRRADARRRSGPDGPGERGTQGAGCGSASLT